MGWMRITSIPAARRRLASEPSRRPASVRIRAARRWPTVRVSEASSDDIGLSASTMSGLASRRTSRFEVERTPPST